MWKILKKDEYDLIMRSLRENSGKIHALSTKVDLLTWGVKNPCNKKIGDELYNRVIITNLYIFKTDDAKNVWVCDAIDGNNGKLYEKIDIETQKSVISGKHIHDN